VSLNPAIKPGVNNTNHQPVQRVRTTPHMVVLTRVCAHSRGSTTGMGARGARINPAVRRRVSASEIIRRGGQFCQLVAWKRSREAPGNCHSSRKQYTGSRGNGTGKRREAAGSTRGARQRASSSPRATRQGSWPRTSRARRQNSRVLPPAAIIAVVYYRRCRRFQSSRPEGALLYWHHEFWLLLHF
jgi:hypothetical protein